MNANFLSSLEHAGAYAVLPRTAIYSEKKALEIHLAALKTAGHAVQADEVIEHGDLSGDIRIFHLLNCKKCAEEKNGQVHTSQK